MVNKPDKINILGHIYNIEYCDKASDVDIHKREALWGQVDYWTRTIRVYVNSRTPEDISETIIHEIIEVLKEELCVDQLKGEDNHDAINLLAIGLNDTLIRNGFMNVREPEKR